MNNSPLLLPANIPDRNPLNEEIAHAEKADTMRDEIDQVLDFIYKSTKISDEHKKLFTAAILNAGKGLVNDQSIIELNAPSITQTSAESVATTPEDSKLSLLNEIKASDLPAEVISQIVSALNNVSASEIEAGLTSKSLSLDELYVNLTTEDKEAIGGMVDSLSDDFTNINKQIGTFIDMLESEVNEGLQSEAIDFDLKGKLDDYRVSDNNRADAQLDVYSVPRLDSNSDMDPIFQFCNRVSDAHSARLFTALHSTAYSNPKNGSENLFELRDAVTKINEVRELIDSKMFELSQFRQNKLNSIYTKIRETIGSIVAKYKAA